MGGGAGAGALADERTDGRAGGPSCGRTSSWMDSRAETDGLARDGQSGGRNVGRAGGQSVGREGCLSVERAGGRPNADQCSNYGLQGLGCMPVCILKSPPSFILLLAASQGAVASAMARLAQASEKENLGSANKFRNRPCKGELYHQLASKKLKQQIKRNQKELGKRRR